MNRVWAAIAFFLLIFPLFLGNGGTDRPPLDGMPISGPSNLVRHIEGGIPLSCEELRDVILMRSISPAGSPDAAEQDALVALLSSSKGIGGVRENESCVDLVLRELMAAGSCGPAAELVTSFAISDGLLSDTQLVELLDSNLPCSYALAGGLQHHPRPSAELSKALITWVNRQSSPWIRSGGLAVLGTHGRRLREQGETEISARIESIIRLELQKKPSSSALLAQKIEAAGNLGCKSCIVEIEGFYRSSSFDVKLAAAAAFRHVNEEIASEITCKILLNAQEIPVREQAAWALGWGQAGLHQRVQCLVVAATTDPKASVRQTAALSLDSLSSAGGIVESALLHLTSPEYDPHVRKIALKALDSPGTREETDPAHGFDERTLKLPAIDARRSSP